MRLVKEGAGEDGGVEEAMDIRISICSMFRAFEICHWTSSSHPYPPSPLHGQLKLHFNYNFLKRKSRLVEAPKEYSVWLSIIKQNDQNNLLPRDSNVAYYMISDYK